MILLDADVIIELERQNEKIIAELEKLQAEHAEMFAISPAVYAEVYYGNLAVPEKAAKVNILLEKFKTLPFNEDSAKIFAKIKFLLDKKGTPIPISDLITASVALEHDSILVSKDEHFKRVPNLKLISLK